MVSLLLVVVSLLLVVVSLLLVVVSLLLVVVSLLLVVVSLLLVVVRLLLVASCSGHGGVLTNVHILPWVVLHLCAPPRPAPTVRSNPTC